MNLQKSIRRILREELNNYEIFNPHNPIYMEAWLEVGDEDIETYKDYGINRIQGIINDVKELKFPLRIYRGINTEDIKGKHNLVSNLEHDNISWGFLHFFMAWHCVFPAFFLYRTVFLLHFLLH